MAKLVLNLDTETGEMVCSVNGVNVDNVNYVRCWTYEEREMGEEPEKCCSFSINSMKKENGVTLFQSVMAKNTKEAQRILSLGGVESKEIPECVIDLSQSSRGDAEQKLKDEMKNYFRKGL